MTRRNILIMAGGTGGHIFPALAVAKMFGEKGDHVRWLGSTGGMEQTLVSRENIELDLLPVSGIRKKGIKALIKAPFQLLRCIWQARKVIKRNKVNLVIGFGGFASGPGGFASWITRTPLVIHEQNAIAGLTNRILSKFAVKVCQAFDKTFENKNTAITTGNPIRAEIIELAKTKSVKSELPLNILIIGGSRGAQIFNLKLPIILSEKIKQREITVWHQTGTQQNEQVLQEYTDIGCGETKVSEFIFDMQEAYSWADLVICRAGALTVSEIALIGLPAIFIPYPYAVDDHQTMNAQALAQSGAAYIVQQDEIKEVEEYLDLIIKDMNKVNQMALAAKQLGKANATKDIVNVCEKVLSGEKL
ncbi:MAG: undecaprenyldiphospho-muramoylpentapeptide beta-N-acetylglucosaminyltransferase [Gammaproteobacteria bacterium]|nr:undecaprenyldiphospho-muramoylpentapeptide beta-N-acetylglucosaminyltransferase [Gammaproteobacteria bacterium]